MARAHPMLTQGPPPPFGPTVARHVVKPAVLEPGGVKRRVEQPGDAALLDQRLGPPELGDACSLVDVGDEMVGRVRDLVRPAPGKAAPAGFEIADVALGPG